MKLRTPIAFGDSSVDLFSGGFERAPERSRFRTVDLSGKASVVFFRMGVAGEVARRLELLSCAAGLLLGDFSSAR